MIQKKHFEEIDLNDIFENDKLDRKDSIENLSSLLASTKNSLVLSINADWGAGKTTFVKLWQAQLQKEKEIQSIYFSAWEDDFSKEPLISILGEINKYISDTGTAKSDTKEKLEKVKEFGGKILKRGLPAFIKGATSGMLDIDKGYEEALSAISEQATKELIDNYSKDKEITKKFKEAIQSLLASIDDTKPFVIFIDELDRCRPLYAIELLERVKHIFGIDGLIFVLSIDKKQLSESIKSEYGNIDASNYLRRFIDLEYNLQNPSIEKFCDHFYYSVYELDKVLRSKEVKTEYSDLNELAMLKYLVKSMDLSLREIEQIFIQINIIFKTVPLRLFEIHFRVIVFFIILKLKDSQLYFNLKNRTFSIEKVFSIVLSKNKIENPYRDISTIIKAIILSTSKTDEEMNDEVKQQKSILDKLIDPIEKRQQEWLLNLLIHGENHGIYRLNQAIKTVMMKIDFLDKFNFELTQK